VIRQLEDLKVFRASSLNKSKIVVQNCQKEVATAEEALDKAKKQYHRAKIEFQRAKEKLVVIAQHVVDYCKTMDEKKKEAVGKETNKYNLGMSRMIISAFESTPEQDRDKQAKKVKRKHNELMQAKLLIGDKKRDLLDRIHALDTALFKVLSINSFM